MKCLSQLSQLKGSDYVITETKVGNLILVDLHFVWSSSWLWNYVCCLNPLIMVIYFCSYDLSKLTPELSHQSSQVSFIWCSDSHWLHFLWSFKILSHHYVMGRQSHPLPNGCAPRRAFGTSARPTPYQHNRIGGQTRNPLSSQKDPGHQHHLSDVFYPQFSRQLASVMVFWLGHVIHNQKVE